MFRTRIRSILRRLTSRHRVDQELDEEIASFVEHAIRGKIEQGMTPEAARRAALLEFGGTEQVKQLMREGRTGSWIDGLLRDVLYAIRMLARYPAFSLLAILTVAFGIGAATAMFSVVDTLILRPLPYRDRERLVSVWAAIPSWRTDPGSSTFWNQIGVEYTDYQQWRMRQTAFEDSSIYRNSPGTFIINDEPRLVHAGVASAPLFSFLGVRPEIGRLFAETDEHEDSGRVVLLSDATWRHDYGGNPSVLGTLLRQSGSAVAYTIAGVLPPEFQLPGHGTNAGPVPDLWVPIGPKDKTDHGSFEIIGRLKQGVTFEAAENETGRIFQELPLSGYPADVKLGAHVSGLQEQETQRLRAPLFILFAASGLLLLIACGNVANLLLGQASHREHEIAVRAALGASRRRVFRQLISESLGLSLGGACIGIIFGLWTIRGLIRLVPEGVPRVSEIGLDFRVLLFTAGVSTITGILFGVAPALALVRLDVQTALKQTVRTQVTHRIGMQKLLIVTEISISFVLLTGAGLLAKSLLRITGVSPGFESSRLLVAAVRLPSRYSDEAQIRSFYASVLERVQSLPGVEAVTAITSAPFSGGQFAARVRPENANLPPGQPGPHMEWRAVLPNYFSTVGIRLLEGRAFTTGDKLGFEGDHFVIVNKAFANAFWPGGSALNKRFRVETNARWEVIVGVVDDAKEFALDEDPRPIFYWPAQSPPQQRRLDLLIRANSPRQLAVAVGREVHGADPELPRQSIDTMDNLVARSFAGERYGAIVITVFAIAALCLALVGLYGVLSRFVASRTREIGIRIAIGASPDSILRTVLKQSLYLTTAGMTVGIACALFATRALSRWLFGVSPIDIPTYIIIAIGFFAVALLASYLPARRAARIDPAECLRSE